MNNHPFRTFPALIRHSVLQAIVLAALAVFLLSFTYGLVQHYQQKRQHIQQLAALLTNSASTENGANLVAKQVSILLDDEPNIQSILFYSTSYPVVNLDQATIDKTSDDWQNALFADTVSFNYAVTNPDISVRVSNKDNNNKNTEQRASSSQPLATTSTSSKPESTAMNTRSTDTNALNKTLDSTLNSNAFDDPNTLLGYINITLDVNQLRWNWFRSHLPLWLIIIALGSVWGWFILRKLSGPVKDVAALAEACDIVNGNPELEQLPIIQQRFELQELIQIKQAFINLFARLQQAKKDYETLADFEQQLHNKDLSLNLQRHNFQSMITHELKTSLNAIVGGLQLLDNQYLNTEQKDVVAIIRKGSRQLVITLEQIIQLNKIEKGQVSINLSEFNPLQLIADLLAEYEPIAKQKGLELTSSIHHIDYILEGDATKIQQILSLLLDNAIKFTPLGKVTIESQLTHFNESNRWQINVKDTGIGIDPDHIDDIFNPFFQVDSSQTREYEGTGIGLLVVKQMAQLIGAAIEVDSTLGIGSQFKIIIPLRNQYQARQQHLFAGLVIVYYYYHEMGFLVDELQRLGATVTCHQYEQLVLDQMNTIKADVVMFAEDVLPGKAETIAKHIRKYETAHRSLLIYWYSPHQASYLDSFEHGLKAAGIDYCHSVIRDNKVLSDRLKEWLA